MTIWTIIIAILVFSALIFVHELGHFCACKLSGVRVNEFAIGMGPVIFKKTRGETQYALRLFPIGGFVAMEGEDEESGDPNSFGKASLWKRFAILLAGPVMNLVLGLFILVLLTSQQNMLGSTVVAGFYETSVSNSQLQVGDQILSVNGKRVRTDNDLSYQFQRDRDGVMDLEVLRGESKVLLRDVTFQMREVEEGIRILIIDFSVKGMPKTFFGVLGNAVNRTGSVVKEVWSSLTDLITGRYGLNQLSGPVGVTSAISQASHMGWQTLLGLVAFITVNLGVFNLLPLPALDGGRLMFLLIELVRRKPVNPRYEGVVNAVGFMLLIGLVIFATFNDLTRLMAK